MVARNAKTDETKAIEELLRPHFGDVEAYRFNSASIRVRVIDERFRDLSKPDREARVAPLLRQLREELEADITLLLLLAPDELASSLMNLEFENPRPSSLL